MRRLWGAVNRLNLRLGVFITNWVGTMWMAYAFAMLALSGLPAALQPGGVGFVQWFAQTFLQLVLLSVILVGQNVQSERQENMLREIRKQGKWMVDMQKALMLLMERQDDRLERVEEMVDALDGELGVQVQGEEGVT